jgi:hypothetical protein
LVLMSALLEMMWVQLLAQKSKTPEQLWVRLSVLMSALLETLWVQLLAKKSKTQEQLWARLLVHQSALLEMLWVQLFGSHIHSYKRSHHCSASIGACSIQTKSTGCCR